MTDRPATGAAMTPLSDRLRRLAACCDFAIPGSVLLPTEVAALLREAADAIDASPPPEKALIDGGLFAPGKIDAVAAILGDILGMVGRCPHLLGGLLPTSDGRCLHAQVIGDAVTFRFIAF